MDELYLSYLGVLNELAGTLDRLSELSRQKADTVRQDDLIALDEVLKQEQAMALNLRGLEQRRLKLVPQLGLDGVPLSGLVAHCPEHLQAQAEQTAQTLQFSYTTYRSCADMARNVLELNLHQIDRFIEAAGVDPKLAAAGYEAVPTAEPPKNMKTDFRA